MEGPISVNELYIITGGPGSGKTTLINALAKRGYTTTTEAGRAIIQQQVAIGGDALPWSDPQAFAELMLDWEVQSYQITKNSKYPAFFDRGIPDVVSYLKLMKLPVPTHVENALLNFKYNRKVFIAPPWSEIFIQDAERKQTLEEAKATYNMLVNTYNNLNYDLIEIPRFSVEERSDFIIQQITS